MSYDIELWSSSLVIFRNNNSFLQLTAFNYIISFDYHPCFTKYLKWLATASMQVRRQQLELDMEQQTGSK